jgi:hypothetical protein
VASGIYGDWFKAIRNKQRVSYVHHGHSREGCPHVLGLDKDGKEKVLVCRVIPGRKGPGEWRCLFVSDTAQILPAAGEWLERAGHKQRNSCVIEVDIDVNRAADQRYRWPG